MSTPSFSDALRTAARTIADAFDTLGNAVADAANTTRTAFVLIGGDPFEPMLPPATAPHGHTAARQIARQLADSGAVSCLVTDGTHHCMGRQCDQPAPTPGEELL